MPPQISRLSRPTVLAVGVLASLVFAAFGQVATVHGETNVHRVEGKLAQQQVSLVVDSSLNGEFTGWTGKTAFDLSNGQVWVQAAYAYRYWYAYSPRIRVFASSGAYWMVVDDDFDNVLQVTSATNAVRSCIDGEFTGSDGDTVFPLCNGQVWRQAGYDYTYRYAYRPRVLIYSIDSGRTYTMKVSGVERTIAVYPLTSSSAAAPSTPSAPSTSGNPAYTRYGLAPV